MLSSEFSEASKNCQIRNTRGHILKCSHYMPSPFPENISLPCVIYCHGNRFDYMAFLCYSFKLGTCAVFFISKVIHWFFNRWLYVVYFFMNVWLWFFKTFLWTFSICGSGCRADANEAAVILLPSNITVFTLDFSGSGLSDGDYVSLGWHEVW